VNESQNGLPNDLQNASSRTVFLFDVDNTLLDNDRVIVHLKSYLVREVGAARADQYFEIFEQLRTELGYSDYLGALQRTRVAHPRDPHLLAVSSFLVNYPFANRLYPGSLDAVEHVAAFGETVIVSDGDVVFQPRKIERAGLWETFGGRVLIYIHKEQELDDVARRYPAEHYVLVDDKIRILTAVKAAWGSRLTTVFPRQGHYAHASDVASYPPPDVTIDRIDQLVNFDLATLLAAAQTSHTS
jgi:FMN phosphatase YigB (HAD superfamily)